jgi:hypothetical protein
MIGKLHELASDSVWHTTRKQKNYSKTNEYTAIIRKKTKVLNLTNKKYTWKGIRADKRRSDL